MSNPNLLIVVFLLPYMQFDDLNTMSPTNIDKGRHGLQTVYILLKLSGSLDQVLKKKRQILNQVCAIIVSTLT